MPAEIATTRSLTPATFEYIEAKIRHDADGTTFGGDFEWLCKWFLENAPRYRGPFDKVWLWKDWPDRWGTDAGIDSSADGKTLDKTQLRSHTRWPASHVADGSGQPAGRYTRHPLQLRLSGRRGRCSGARRCRLYRPQAVDGGHHSGGRPVYEPAPYPGAGLACVKAENPSHTERVHSVPVHQTRRVFTGFRAKGTICESPWQRPGNLRNERPEPQRGDMLVHPLHALSSNAMKDFLCEIRECCRATLFPGTLNPRWSFTTKPGVRRCHGDLTGMLDWKG